MGYFILFLRVNYDTSMRRFIWFRFDRVGVAKLFIMYAVHAVKQAPVRTAW